MTLQASCVPQKEAQRMSELVGQDEMCCSRSRDMYRGRNDLNAATHSLEGHDDCLRRSVFSGELKLRVSDGPWYFSDIM